MAKKRNSKRGHRCELCGKDGFSSSDAVVEHIKTQHCGKLSEGSIEWCLRQGITPKHLIDWCKRNEVKVDESKVYKIARRLVREGVLVSIEGGVRKRSKVATLSQFTKKRGKEGK